MTDAWDAEDQAIARALDGVPEQETAGADERLVDEYREVLGSLEPAGAPLPLELEDRVIDAALARRPAAGAPDSSPATNAVVPSLDRARERRRLRLRVATLAATAVAAAVVVGVIITNTKTNSPGASGHLSLTTVKRADVDALLRAPGTRAGSFGAGLGNVAIGTDGSGAVYDLRGTAPVVIRLVSGGGTAVLPSTAPSGGAVAFVVDHPERVTTVTLSRGGVEIGRADLSAK
jgi:hypothetical protein